MAARRSSGIASRFGREARDASFRSCPLPGGAIGYLSYEAARMFEELPELRPYLKRGIIDTLFISDDGLIPQICRDYRRLTSQNSAFLKDSSGDQFHLR